VFRDVGSGTLRKRPQLEACLDYLRSGDTLVVWRLDRLGRSLRHLVDVVARLQEREIAFRSLHENIDTATSTGRLTFHLFAALAEFERELIRERSQAGREVAKAAGRLGGRPVKLTPEKKAAALAMRERGDMTMSQIARALGVGRTTLYDHIGELPPLDGIPREDAEDGLAA
jgi:DNA invertase Pin-like site-specific DNA recombinase